MELLRGIVYVDSVCDLKRERLGTELCRVYGVYKIGVLKIACAYYNIDNSDLSYLYFIGSNACCNLRFLAM